MNAALMYVSQLSAGHVAWGEYSQTQGVLNDLAQLVPLSVPMRVELSPWLAWLDANDGVGKQVHVTRGTTMGEVIAQSMKEWSRDWESRLGYDTEQSRVFFLEWEHVLRSPALAGYRHSLSGSAQLGILGHRISNSEFEHSQKMRDHMASVRGQWAYATLRAFPYGEIGRIACWAWGQQKPEARQALDAQWAQWYAMFDDEDMFMHCVRQGVGIANTELSLPPELGQEA